MSEKRQPQSDQLSGTAVKSVYTCKLAILTQNTAGFVGA